MISSWLGMLMISGWSLTLWGGLGSHALENFDGRKLEAYCRFKRNYPRFGDILDRREQVVAAARYLLLCGLVLGSMAAGAWYTTPNLATAGANELTTQNLGTTFGWLVSWILLLMLAGLWLPQIVVRYSSSFFVFHSWPAWRILAVMMGPLVALGEGFAWLGQRLSDNPTDDSTNEETLEDEIRTIVATGQREGVFSEGVPEMIQGVMELDECDVDEIMTPRSIVDAVDIEQPWDDVVKQVVATGRTRLPVYRGNLDNVVGILFVKDLLKVLANAESTGPETLESILRKPWFIPASKPVDELLRVFLHNRNHMAVVIDEYQQFVGVVTIEDALEEIVGEIADELDEDEDSEIVYNEHTHQIEAEGKVPIDSLSKLLGIELPDADDYDTIGGLVVHRLGEIPSVGTVLKVDGVQITVLQATKRIVQRVRLELVSEDDASETQSSDPAKD
jgi:putative hemolysin